MFDPPEMVSCTKIPFEMNDCEEHRRLALETAEKSIVLLKNKDGLLPLDKNKLKTIAVIGPNADDKRILLGNYFGTPSKYVTPLSGIREAVGASVKILYAEGCDLTATEGNFLEELAT
jgi:beta-glucosidase